MQVCPKQLKTYFVYMIDLICCSGGKRKILKMNCTPKIGNNFGRCSFFMSKYLKEIKEKVISLFEYIKDAYSTFFVRLDDIRQVDLKH